MSIRSSARNLFPPLDNPELIIQRRSRADPTILNDFEMAAEGNGDPPILDLRTMKELCQPSLNGRGGPIAPIAIQETNFELNNDMIQQPPLAKPKTYMLREPTKVVILTNLKMNTASSSRSRTLPSNNITNPKEDLKGITTCSGTAYQGPTIPTTSSSLPKVVERETEVTKDTMPPTNNGSTKDVQPLVVQIETHVLNYEPVVAPVVEPVAAPVSVPKPNQKPSIPYPSRLHDQKLRDKTNDEKEKFFKIFQDLYFNINFADALILMLKFGPSIKFLLKKLPEKLGDLGKFLIPCEFLGMDECLALTDLGASINLMPLFMWNKLSLPQLTPILMTLKLTDQSISRPIGVVEDVYVKVGKFLFSADFVVVDFDADPRVPLILGRSFLMTGRALIDVFKGELTLHVEVDAFLALEDDATSPKVDHSYYNPEGDILLLEALHNDDPSLSLPNKGNYFPQVRKELKICEAKNDKSSIDEPPEIELKYLPPHLEYAFLDGDDKLPVIITKDLSVEERAALIKVLKSHKQAITWKLSNIKGKEYYCFLDGFSGYFQILVDPKDQEKTTFTCPYGMFAYRRMPFGLCNAPGTLQRCMMAIFHDMIEKTMEVFMDDFLEKSHFMVKEVIVLGYKILKNRIEVDKAKALGFQNPCYLKKAQQLKPKLYDGRIIEKSDAAVIPDTEETLMLAEESLQTDEPNLSATTTIVEVLKEFLKVSMVNSCLKKLKYHLASFDMVVKERTTATTITKGTLGFKHNKACFCDDIIPFVKALKDLFTSFDQYLIDEVTEVQNVFKQMELVVEQHREEKHKFQNKMEHVLQENDRLLTQALSVEIVNVAVHDNVISECLNVDVCTHCVTIESELKKDFIKKECYETLLQQYYTLEKHCISLEVINQLKKEIFHKNTLSSSESAPTFLEFFEINELKAQDQAKDTMILQLKEKLRSLKEQCDDLINKVNLKSAEVSDLNASLQEKDLVITALKEQLSKLKGKAVLTEAVSLIPIGLELLKVDVAPLVPKLRKNRTAHTDYIRHTQDEAATLREIVERVILVSSAWKPTGNMFKTVGHIWKPTGWTFKLVGNVCPLTRIATPTIVPPRVPIQIVNSMDKPVVTLVYTRKPKAANKKVPNKLEPNNSWGSSSSNVHSLLLTCRLSKSFSGTWTPVAQSI
nr:reverse transcriptase domain-containing protein [Tanacetum cinerariifolium]